MHNVTSITVIPWLVLIILQTVSVNDNTDNDNDNDNNNDNDDGFYDNCRNLSPLIG